MNQSQLIEAVYKNMLAHGSIPVSKVQVERCVKEALSVIHDQLVAGESVRLHGFGTFKTLDKKARKGRNPQTGKRIRIPAKRVAKFVPGAILKKDVAASK